MKNTGGLFSRIPLWLWAVLGLLFLTLFYYHPLILHPTSMQAGYDMISYYYPYWQFIKDHNIADGELPLWNDSILCGTTIIGNAHFSFYYPPNWLFLKLPFPIALHIWYVIHIFLAGIGCYLFSRYHKLRRLAAIYGSIIYMFGAHIAVRINIGHYDHISAMAWIPFSFLFLNKLLDDSNFKNCFLFGLFLGIHLLTLHLQIFYYSLLALAIFTICILIFKGRETGFNFKRFLALGKFAIFSGIIAVGLASAQLLYILQSVPYSQRAERTYETFSRISLPPLQALGFFLPDLWGTDASYAGASNYWELSCFIGFSTILAIIWAFKKKNLVVSSLIITGIASLLFSMGKYTPFGKLLYHMPFMSFSRIPARFLVITVFSLSACSVFGINNLVESLSKQKTRNNFFIISLTIISFLTSVFYLFSIIGNGRLIEKIFYPRCNNPAKMVLLFRNSIGRDLIVLLIIWILYVILKLRMINHTFITSSLVIVLFVELWTYNLPLSRLIPVDKLEEGFDRLKILKKGEPSEKFRVLGVEYLYQRGLYKHAIERFDGYEPLIEKHLFMIYMKIEKQLELDHTSYMKFLLYASELANTKYLVFRRKLDIDVKDWFRRGTIIIKGTRYQLFQTNNYNPRAYFSDTLQRGRNIRDFYSFVMRKDYKKAVYIENKSAQGSNRIEKIEKIRYTPNKVTLSFKCEKSGIAVLNDVLFPGWEAYLDKKRTDILRVNYAFRGVQVGPGEHILEFTYKPELLNIGRIVSFLTVLVFLFSLFFNKFGLLEKIMKKDIRKILIDKIRFRVILKNRRH